MWFMGTLLELLPLDVPLNTPAMADKGCENPIYTNDLSHYTLMTGAIMH